MYKQTSLFDLFPIPKKEWRMSRHWGKQDEWYLKRKYYAKMFQAKINTTKKSNYKHR